MTDNSEANFTSQIAYGSKKWGVAAGYRYGQCGAKFRTGTEYTKANKWHQACTNAAGERTGAESHSWAFNAFWRPEESGIVPSISAGVGASYLDGDFHYNNPEKFASWMVGLQWSDVFQEGNDLGFAIGQPQFVVSTDKGTPDDGNYAIELWYQYEVTDNISVTPGIYWLSRPYGDGTPDDKSFGVFGGVVQTVFKF